MTHHPPTRYAKMRAQRKWRELCAWKRLRPLIDEEIAISADEAIEEQQAEQFERDLIARAQRNHQAMMRAHADMQREADERRQLMPWWRAALRRLLFGERTD